MTNLPETTVNSLKIRLYSLRNLLCCKKICLCETAKHLTTENFIKILVRQVEGGLTPIKTDKLKAFKIFSCQAVRVRVRSH